MQTVSFNRKDEIPFRTILDGIGDAISVLDTSWGILYVNPVAAAAARRRGEDLVGRCLWELFPELSGTEFEIRARRAVAEQRPAFFDCLFPTTDRWFAHRFHPVPQGLLIHSCDIDERKRVELETLDRVVQDRSLFESTHDGIVVLDDSGCYVDVNQSMCRILKGTREEIVGQHFSRFVPPEQMAASEIGFADLRAGNAIPREFPLLALDGTLVELEWSSSSHHQLNLSFCVCRDLSEHKQTQASLRKSEERQRRAVEAGKVGLWEWDIANNKVSWSDYVYHLHGLQPGTFDGSFASFSKLIDPADQEHVGQALQQALEGTGEYHVEFRTSRHGQTRWVRTTGEVTFDEDRRPTMMHGAVTDVTEEKLALETQQAVEQQLMLLVEASGAILASPHSEEVLQTILELAQRFVAADGYSVWRKQHDGSWRIATSAGLSENFITSGFVENESQPPPTGPMAVEDVFVDPRVARRRAVYTDEGIRSMLAIPLRIHKTSAGTVVFYWRSVHRITAAETRIASALGNLAATALTTAELYDRQATLLAEAEAAHQRATFLAEAGAVLSSSLDYEATLKSVASLALRGFADWAAVDVLDEQGQSRRVAIAHSDPAKVQLAEQFAQRYPPRESDLSTVALREGKSFLLENISDEFIAQRARDPEHLRLMRTLGLRSAILVPMVMGESRLGIISFVTAESGRHYTQSDLATAEELARRAALALENARLFKASREAQTKLQEQNEKLRRANEDLNQFAYSASHDLQEPLRIVSIYSELLRLQSHSGLDEASQRYLTYIHQGTRRIDALLRDILAYTQAGSAAQQEAGPVESAAVLEKALSNLQATVRDLGATVLHQDLPQVRVVEVHLLQLFQNLIGNALKYHSSRPPEIVISAAPDACGVRFSIRDNGIGIDAQYHDVVFGLFKRLHSGDVYAGTGVGLAICQKIVERYGGRIWVESALDQGSTFCFTLPTEPKPDC